MENFVLNKTSEELIKSTLNVRSLNDVIDFDYNDHAPTNEHERVIAERFRYLNRGSARFAMKTFYTQDELKEASEKLKNATLP